MGLWACCVLMGAPRGGQMVPLAPELLTRYGMFGGQKIR